MIAEVTSCATRGVGGAIQAGGAAPDGGAAWPLAVVDSPDGAWEAAAGEAVVFGDPEKVAERFRSPGLILAKLKIHWKGLAGGVAMEQREENDPAVQPSDQVPQRDWPKKIFSHLCNTPEPNQS
jgi:hypothetical protein